MPPINVLYEEERSRGSRFSTDSVTPSCPSTSSVVPFPATVTFTVCVSQSHRWTAALATMTLPKDTSIYCSGSAQIKLNASFETASTGLVIRLEYTLLRQLYSRVNSGTRYGMEIAQVSTGNKTLDLSDWNQINFETHLLTSDLITHSDAPRTLWSTAEIHTKAICQSLSMIVDGRHCQMRGKTHS